MFGSVCSVSVEAAGGRALACVVDIRDEQQIGDAVEKAVHTFGGGLSVKHLFVVLLHWWCQP